MAYSVDLRMSAVKYYLKSEDTIEETAKANALDPYRYILFLLEELPNADRSRSDWLNPFLPWNAPDDCRVTRE